MLSRHRREIFTFCAGGRGRSDDIDPGVFVRPFPDAVTAPSPTLMCKNIWSNVAGTSLPGASIYDVRTEGGGGVSPEEDVVREVA